MALKIKPKFRLNTKILLTLLGLSLLPLILFIFVFRFEMTSLENKVREDLIIEAKEDLIRLAREQAQIADAMLDKVMDEVGIAAQFISAFWNAPSRFGPGRAAYSAEEEPEDRNLASVYAVAPDVAIDEVKEELDLLSNMDQIFMKIRDKDDEDEYLDSIYVGTESGIFRGLPWDPAFASSLEATLDLNFQSYLSDGKISEELRQELESKKIGLSSESNVKKKGDRWLITDMDRHHVYSVRKEEDKLAIYVGYDPRIRQWYKSAKEAAEKGVNKLVDRCLHINHADVLIDH